MTDLRDRLDEFEAAAARLTSRVVSRQPGLRLVWAVPAGCHRDRPMRAQGLCGSCYTMAWNHGRLPEKQSHRKRIDFVADYVMLRSEGYTRRQIAERLRMSYTAVTNAYRRAVRAGLLTADRRTS